MAKKKDEDVLTAGVVNEEIEVNIEATGEDTVEVVEATETVEAEVPEPAVKSAEDVGFTMNDLKEAMIFLAFKTLEPSELKEFKMRLGE